MTSDVALYATIGMGVVNVLMTLISLVLVERAGRKSLLMVGLVGLQVVTVLLTISLALKVKIRDRKRSTAHVLFFCLVSLLG